MCIHKYVYTYIQMHIHIYMAVPMRLMYYAYTYIYIHTQMHENGYASAYCTWASQAGTQGSDFRAAAQNLWLISIGHLRRPPNVPLLRALWSLLDGILGLLKGGWGVLVPAKSEMIEAFLGTRIVPGMLTFWGRYWGPFMLANSLSNHSDSGYTPFSILRQDQVQSSYGVTSEAIMRRSQGSTDPEICRSAAHLTGNNMLR